MRTSQTTIPRCSSSASNKDNGNQHERPSSSPPLLLRVLLPRFNVGRWLVFGALATVLYHQYRFAREAVDVVTHTELLTTDVRATVASPTAVAAGIQNKRTPTTTQLAGLEALDALRLASNRTETNTIETKKSLLATVNTSANTNVSFLSTQPPQPMQSTPGSGGDWKAAVRAKLEKEERARTLHVSAKSKRHKDVHTTFAGLYDRLDAIGIEEVDDPSSWHTVSPERHVALSATARSSLEELVTERVDTDCTLWLVPPASIEAWEVERTDRRDKDELTIKKRSRRIKAGPDVRFECGNSSQTKQLRKEPCAPAVLCKVRSDLGDWRDYYLRSERKSKSHYNYTRLEAEMMPSSTSSQTSARSAILTMVDTTWYLRHGKSSPDTLGREQPFIWESFLNKASYALRTNRDLYIWIGGFEDKDEDGKANKTDKTKKSSSSSILHERNAESVSETFGTVCHPEFATKNVVHYYKPIAFAAFFRKVASDLEDARAWFVDADMIFNIETFPPRSNQNYHKTETRTKDPNARLPSLDDYFDLSPQASLLGSQNPSGKDENILINGGLLGLRRLKTNDWVLDFAALWWHCRCGERDQIALWLLLFATWSAESGAAKKSGKGKSKSKSNSFWFSYPGVAFENYIMAWCLVIPHGKTWFPLLQSAWERDTLSSSSTSSWTTVPSNPSLFNGGDGFLESSTSGIYTYPLELPHVLLLPLDPFALPPNTTPDATSTAPTKRTDFSLGIVKKAQPGKRALLTHNKNMLEACYDFKCWPFLIRTQPSRPAQLDRDEKSKKKSNKKKKK